MEKFLDCLYQLYLKKEDFPFGKPDKDSLDQEWNIYEFLYKHLPDEYKKIFVDYVNLRGARDNEEKQTVYKNGFKNGMRFMIETLALQ